MSMKGTGEPVLHEIDRWGGGVGWMAYPDEFMQRASHALAVDGNVYVVDPVDAPGLDDLLAEYGEVAGVVVAVDRHKRDAAAVARRHDVPVYLADWMSGVAEAIDAPVELFTRELADTGYRTLRIKDSRLPPWQEVGFYHDDLGTLVVQEALGTTSYFRVGAERIGVHPAIRMTPPRRALGGLTPDRILVGHGEGISRDATAALQDALDGARRRTPALYLKTLRTMLRR